MYIIPDGILSLVQTTLVLLKFNLQIPHGVYTDISVYTYGYLCWVIPFFLINQNEKKIKNM